MDLYKSLSLQVCWAQWTGPLQKQNKVEYPKRRRVHHEEEVRRTVQSTGCPRGSERGAYAPEGGKSKDTKRGMDTILSWCALKKIYRIRENLWYCQEYGIRFSGPKLGRPFKESQKNRALLREKRRIERQDESTRIAVEGKFGEGKRRYSLDRIVTKLRATSESAIQLVFLVMNLMVLYRRNAKAFFVALFYTLIERLRRAFWEANLSAYSCLKTRK